MNVSADANTNDAMDASRDAESIAASIRRDIDNRIVLHIASRVPGSFSLTRTESSYCRESSAKRLADFTAGRYCSAQVLKNLGLPRTSIAVGKSREPLWPDGIVGSISHTHEMAGAIATLRSTAIGIGLDLERRRPMDDVSSQVCTSSELENLPTDFSSVDTINVVFSAKESIYKCVWPLFGQFVSFQDIEIQLDCVGHGFRVVAEHVDIPAVLRIRGRWIATANYVATIAILTPA